MIVDRYGLAAISIMILYWLAAIGVTLCFIALKVWIIISVYQWMVS